MKPKSQSLDALAQFQAHFDQRLNPDHRLVKLAQQIDWKVFDTTFGNCESCGPVWAG